jgi:hypothetical protein
LKFSETEACEWVNSSLVDDDDARFDTDVFDFLQLLIVQTIIRHLKDGALGWVCDAAWQDRRPPRKRIRSH